MSTYYALYGGVSDPMITRMKGKSKSLKTKQGKDFMTLSPICMEQLTLHGRHECLGSPQATRPLLFATAEFQALSKKMTYNRSSQHHPRLLLSNART